MVLTLSLYVQTLLVMLLCQHGCHHLHSGQCEQGKTGHLKVRACLPVGGQPSIVPRMEMYCMMFCLVLYVQEEELKKLLLIVFANKRVNVCLLSLYSLLSF